MGADTWKGGESRRHRLMAAACGLLMVAVLASGCGAAEDERREETSTTRAAFNNDDAAGREQAVPAATRIDVGGDERFRSLALAAAEDVTAAHPDQHVTWEATYYGRTVWGICLGSLEAALLDDREGWGIEQCEKSGIRIISLPLAQGVWLAVSDRAAVRPEVATYVRSTLDTELVESSEVDLEPFDDAALARSRAAFDRFLADARRAGVEPVVG